MKLYYRLILAKRPRSDEALTKRGLSFLEHKLTIGLAPYNLKPPSLVNINKGSKLSLGNVLTRASAKAQLPKRTRLV